MTKLTTSFTACTALALLAIGAVPQAHAQSYTFTDLGTLGGNVSIATSVNNAGQVVGWAFSPIYGESRPTYWNGTNLADLGTVGGNEGYAYEINNANQIVGWRAAAGGVGRATLWSGGSAIDLGTLGGSYGQARAINDAGQVAGS